MRRFFAIVWGFFVRPPLQNINEPPLLHSTAVARNANFADLVAVDTPPHGSPPRKKFKADSRKVTSADSVTVDIPPSRKRYYTDSCKVTFADTAAVDIPPHGSPPRKRYKAVSTSSSKSLLVLASPPAVYTATPSITDTSTSPTTTDIITAAVPTAVTPADGATTGFAATKAARACRKGLSMSELFEKLLLRAESRGTPDTFLNVARHEQVKETHLQAFEQSLVQDGMQMTYELVVPMPTMDAEELKKNAAKIKKKAAQVEEEPGLAVPDHQIITMEIEEQETDIQEEIEYDYDYDYSSDRQPERKRRTRLDRKKKRRKAFSEALSKIEAGARRERQYISYYYYGRGKKLRTKRKKGLRSETRRSRQETEAETDGVDAVEKVSDAVEESESTTNAGSTNRVGDAGEYNIPYNMVDRDENSDSSTNPNVQAAATSGVVSSHIRASPLIKTLSTTPRNRAYDEDDEDAIEEIPSPSPVTSPVIPHRRRSRAGRRLSRPGEWWKSGGTSAFHHQNRDGEE